MLTIGYTQIQSIVLSFIQNNVTDNGICLRLQMVPTQLGPIDRVSVCPAIGKCPEL
jgi:hypothetical protein